MNDRKRILELAGIPKADIERRLDEGISLKIDKNDMPNTRERISKQLGKWISDEPWFFSSREGWSMDNPEKAAKRDTKMAAQFKQIEKAMDKLEAEFKKLASLD